MLDSLINKYGNNITVNGTPKVAHIENDINNVFRKTNKLFDFLSTIEALTLFRFDENDTIVYNSETYKYLKQIEAPIYANTKYYDTILYKDEFTHDAKFYKQITSVEGCNLPSTADVEYFETKVMLRTKKAQDILQMQLQGAKPPTHTILLHYSNLVKYSDLLVANNRKYEILHLENIDEANKFLLLECIEVL